MPYSLSFLTSYRPSRLQIGLRSTRLSKWLVAVTSWCVVSLLLVATGPIATTSPQTVTSTATSPVTSASSNDGAASPASNLNQSKIAEKFGQLPMRFEANTGQVDASVKFLARGSGYTLFLTNDEMIFSLRQAEAKATNLAKNSQTEPTNPQISEPYSVESGKQELKQTVVRMKWAGGNATPELVGVSQLPGITNYFTGNDPAKWRTNIASYERIEYREVYPGINLVFYGNQQQLEYDFVVAPGTDPNQIRLNFEGATKLEVNPQGELVLQTEFGPLVHHAPKLYQDFEGQRNLVEGRYRLLPATAENSLPQIGFEAKNYNPAHTLTIDPLIAFSTFLGGWSEAATVKVDSSGNIFIGGKTVLDMPVTPGAFQTTHTNTNDAYVLKLNSSGTALIYCSYLDGNSDENIYSLALDNAGNAYLPKFCANKGQVAHEKLVP